MKYTWQFNERKHTGVDFSDPEQVNKYDLNHEKFRDYEKQSAAVINALGLKPDDIVIDMGSGTGAFALNAAKHCRTVYAIDISKAMIGYSREKAAKEGIKNVIFCEGGILTYTHNTNPADAIVCIAVLHHLPDFWKLAGLKRMNKMLKPGGKFFLFDVVFPSDRDDYTDSFDNWIESFEKNVGPAFAKEGETHIRDEFSTYDWIMEGMLKRSGFSIVSIQQPAEFQYGYICRKQS
jgi:putative AdoMet-dependent methyltransferase